MPNDLEKAVRESNLSETAKASVLRLMETSRMCARVLPVIRDVANASLSLSNWYWNQELGRYQNTPVTECFCDMVDAAWANLKQKIDETTTKNSFLHMDLLHAADRLCVELEEIYGLGRREVKP